MLRRDETRKFCRRRTVGNTRKLPFFQMRRACIGHLFMARLRFGSFRGLFGRIAGPHKFRGRSDILNRGLESHTGLRLEAAHYSWASRCFCLSTKLSSTPTCCNICQITQGTKRTLAATAVGIHGCGLI